MSDKIVYWEDSAAATCSEGQGIDIVHDFSSKCDQIIKVVTTGTNSGLPGNSYYNVDGAKITYHFAHCYTGVFQGGRYYPSAPLSFSRSVFILGIKE